MKALIIILFFISCLSSCTPTRNLSFEVMSPSLVNLPDNKGNYLVLNSSYVKDDSIEIEDLFSLQKVFADTMIIRQLFNGLFSILDESPVNGLYNAEYMEIRTTDTTGFLNPLLPLAVADICNEHKVDYLISFEYYSHVHLKSGYLNLAFSSIIDTLVWRIYNKDGDLLDNYFFRDTLYWNSSGSDYWDAVDRLTNPLECIREAYWIAGNEYGKRISPYWETVNRLYYEFREKTDSGMIDISKNKNRLEVYGLADKKTKAYKACYNLAVISESEGEIVNALSWIDKALNHKQFYYAKRYTKTLQSRQKSLERLKKQTE